MRLNAALTTRATPPLEVQGPHVANAGDALMLAAIVDRFGEAYTLVAKPAPCREAVEIGLALHPLHRIARNDRLDALCHGLVPGAVRRRLGWVSRSMLLGTLDCSGYAYGEPWGRGRLRKMARGTQRRLQEGQKLIFLPQMFGRIEDPESREHLRRTIAAADLVFARDRTSLQNLLDLGVSDVNLRCAPDFTLLVEGELPEALRPPPLSVAIVPNERMLDKPAEHVREAYVPFLARSVRGLRARGFSPFLVLHARDDVRLVERLQTELEITLPPVVDQHPKVLKGILGACHALIGSRYHALIGALSQDVPAIGTSWTHKYEMLFDEYGCPECMLSPEASDEELNAALDRITEDPGRSRLQEGLARANDLRRGQCLAMWEEVEAKLREGGAR